MKTKKRIKRLIRELHELEQAHKDGRLAGMSLIGQPDANISLGVQWSNLPGVGS